MTARYIVERNSEETYAPDFSGAVNCLKWQVVHWHTHQNIYMGGQCFAWTFSLLLRLSWILEWYSVGMLGRILTISLIAAVMLLIILLQTTTPATIGPLGILFVFVLMYVSVLCVLTFLFFTISRVVARISSSITVKRPWQPLTLVRSYYFSSVIALAPVMLVGMQSVGEVSFYEVMLIVVFIVISCVYIAKRTA